MNVLNSFKYGHVNVHMNVLNSYLKALSSLVWMPTDSWHLPLDAFSTPE